MIFISAFFLELILKAYNTYVYDLENEPLKVLNEFYLDFNKNLFNASGIKNLKQFILKEINFIDNQFELDIDCDKKVEVKSDFKKKMNNAFANLNYKIYHKDQEVIIEKLYCINQALKNKDFTGTIYSNEFFHNLKKVIINSEIFYSQHLRRNFEECLNHIKSLIKSNTYNLLLTELISILGKILE